MSAYNPHTQEDKRANSKLKANLGYIVGPKSNQTIKKKVRHGDSCLQFHHTRVGHRAAVNLKPVII